MRLQAIAERPPRGEPRKAGVKAQAVSWFRLAKAWYSICRAVVADEVSPTTSAIWSSAPTSVSYAPVMVVYAFYIFDRHAECIYKKRWTPRPPSSTGSKGVITGAAPQPKALSAEDDAKLIFGTVFSLRNMTRKLGGQEDNFISYRTGHYKLHYYETPTSLKFVMVTDTKANNLRIVLHQIYVSLYVEYVVKNPLSPIEHPGGVGVDCEMFELGVEQFVVRYPSHRDVLGVQLNRMLILRTPL
ncbi:MAG: hypothetical protein Q9207_000092 [Kuettlingeria erythrocarpa]